MLLLHLLKSPHICWHTALMIDKDALLIHVMAFKLVPLLSVAP